jgi:two-component system, sporulation sensor kinase E
MHITLDVLSNEDKIVESQIFKENLQVNNVIESAEEVKSISYTCLLDALTYGVLVVSVAADGGLGKFIEVNQVVSIFTGFKKEELLEMKPAELFEAIPRGIIEEVQLNLNKTYLFKTFCLTKGGEKLPVWINARALEMKGQIAILLLGREITPKKKNKEEFVLSERTFFQVCNMVPSMIAITTIVEERIIYVNDSFINGMGYQQDELLLRTIEELGIWVVPEDHKRLIKKIKEKQSFFNYEIKFKRFDGEMGIGLVSAQSITLSQQKVVLYVINDITERKLYQQELARVDRLNLVGEIAAEIGHEIRNPLTTIRGFFQLAKSDESVLHNPEINNVMIEEIDRANGIITEFLCLAKGHRVDLKYTDINKIIRSVLSLLKAEASGQKKQIVFCPGQIPLLFVDASDINQLIINLVYNGLEAMSAGGVVLISSFKEDDNVIISVRDQGKGIPPDHIPRLGTPFFTTKENGTGLGLALCYSIAARNHANIEVLSNEQGTTILVKFKLKDHQQ